MTITSISACITTEKVAESREFYVRHFAAQLTFDCGWYINLKFGQGPSTLQFMAPREGQRPCDPAGLMYNLAVPDVDAEYLRLTEEGLTPVMALEDHPWGDRGFAILDPSGVTLYIYSEREPNEEFRQYYNS